MSAASIFKCLFFSVYTRSALDTGARAKQGPVSVPGRSAAGASLAPQSPCGRPPARCCSVRGRCSGAAAWGVIISCDPPRINEPGNCCKCFYEVFGGFVFGPTTCKGCAKRSSTQRGIFQPWLPSSSGGNGRQQCGSRKSLFPRLCDVLDWFPGFGPVNRGPLSQAAGLAELPRNSGSLPIHADASLMFFCRESLCKCFKT